MKQNKVTTVIEALTAAIPAMEFKQKENDGDHEVVGVLKSLTLKPKELYRLGDVLTGHNCTVTFGRTGANFRMVIK